MNVVYLIIGVFLGVDLIAAFYGCLYVGCVPVTIRPPHPQNIATTLPTVKMIVEVSKSSAILTNSIVHKLLKTKASVLREHLTVLDHPRFKSLV